MAACAGLLAACATITKGTARRDRYARRRRRRLHDQHGERTADGNDTRHRHTVQRLRVAADPMREGMLRHRHKRNPVECRSHGRRQRYFRRRDRPRRRRGQRRPEQIPRSGHRGDVARSGLPEAAAGFAARTTTNVESLTRRRDSMCADEMKIANCVYVVLRACSPHSRT